jgi:DNA-binding IclR family transcriptional regulator
VILAFLPEEKQENLIKSVPMQPFTRHTISDPQVLREELEKIRKRGFAYSHGEWIQDASGVAAPIYGPDRIAIGALTISGPSQRFTRDVIEKYGREVVPAASEISRLLGYSSNPSYVQYRK